jgi:hypothetical protein
MNRRVFMFSASLRGSRSAQSTATQLAAFSPKPSRARPRATALALLISLATIGLALAPQAASAAVGSFGATISPNVAQVGTSTAFTVTVTNQSSAGEIRKIVVKVPTGFTITSVGTPSPGTWTVTRSGNEVILQGSLKPGASVNIPITATAPTTPGGYTWTINASGVSGAFTRVGSSPSVTVAQAAATVFCNANTPCVSPTLSAGASPTALATDAQVTGQSGPQADQLTVVLPDPTAAPLLCQQTGGNFGSIVTWNVTTRTSTLVYTVHPTNPGYVYDLTDTCFGSTQPFAGAVQNPANGNEFEGTLQFCNVPNEPSQTNPPPCVVSIVSTRTDVDGDDDAVDDTDPQTVTVTVNAPQGDPKFTG